MRMMASTKLRGCVHKYHVEHSNGSPVHSPRSKCGPLLKGTDQLPTVVTSQPTKTNQRFAPEKTQLVQHFFAFRGIVQHALRNSSTRQLATSALRSQVVWCGLVGGWLWLVGGWLVGWLVDVAVALGCVGQLFVNRPFIQWTNQSTGKKQPFAIVYRWMSM